MIQKERILKALRTAGEQGVTTVDMVSGALGEPILRGAARIEELRDEGYAIKTVKLKNMTARYVLVMSSQPASRGVVDFDTTGSGVDSLPMGDPVDWTSEVSLFDDSELEWV
jgi:hypothetical protein